MRPDSRLLFTIAGVLIAVFVERFLWDGGRSMLVLSITEPLGDSPIAMGREAAGTAYTKLSDANVAGMVISGLALAFLRARYVFALATFILCGAWWGLRFADSGSAATAMMALGLGHGSAVVALYVLVARLPLCVAHRLALMCAMLAAANLGSSTGPAGLIQAFGVESAMSIDTLALFGAIATAASVLTVGVLGLIILAPRQQPLTWDITTDGAVHALCFVALGICSSALMQFSSQLLYGFGFDATYTANVVRDAILATVFGTAAFASLSRRNQRHLASLAALCAVGCMTASAMVLPGIMSASDSPAVGLMRFGNLAIALGEAAGVGVIAGVLAAPLQRWRPALLGAGLAAGMTLPVFVLPLEYSDGTVYLLVAASVITMLVAAAVFFRPRGQSVAA